MRRAGTTSWQMGEDVSVSLSVALYVRDALGLPATKPFFIPPVVPAVPEHVPVIGPDVDIDLADEWPKWFLDLPSKASSQPVPGMFLQSRSPAFRQAVEGYLEPAERFATAFRDNYFHPGYMKSQGLHINHLVSSIEKELGHRAAPFTLQLRILPVEGAWLHRAAPDLVLLSAGARADPAQLHRLLGPIIRELA